MTDNAVNTSDRYGISSQAIFKKQKRKTPSFGSQQLVTLFAGSGANVQLFIMHKEFACHYSPVLSAALNSSFIEGQTQQYHLEETDTEVIRLLVHWLYTQKLAEIETIDKILRPNCPCHLCKFVKLWVLGDRLLLPQLQNLVLHKLVRIRTERKQIPTHCIPLIFENTSKGSLLRAWVVGQCGACLNAEFYSKNTSQFPYEALLELVEWHGRQNRLKSLEPFDMSKYMASET